MQMNKLLGTCLLCAWAWGQQANAQESIKVGDTTRNMITYACLLYTSPSPRDRTRSRMPSSA